MAINYVKMKNTEDILVNKQEKGLENGTEFLNPGLYKVGKVSGLFSYLPYLQPLTLNEGLVDFTSLMTEFTRKVDSFFLPETVAKYKEMKINHQVAYIFYGPKGTGKTSLALLIMQNLTKSVGAIGLDATDKGIHVALDLIADIREIEKTPIVLFIDECDISMKSNESTYLSFLDGTNSYEDIIFLGATNNLEKIPSRIKNRKGRVKECIEIASLPREVYASFVNTKAPTTSEEFKSEIVYKATDAGLSIDQLKSALLDVLIEGYSIDRAIDIAKVEYKSGKKNAYEDSEDEN